MPISPSAGRTAAAAGEFKETTAAFRKTGPVEKYGVLPENIIKLAKDGIGPIAPRVEELQAEGKKLSLSAVRGAEVAAKLQRGEALTPTEIAQAWVSVREGLDVGLADADSPYYQATTSLRTQRRNELMTLGNELAAFLTMEGRQPHDVTITRTRRRWTGIDWVRTPNLPFIGPQRLFPYPRRADVPYTVTQRVTPGINDALTSVEIGRSNTQLRALEAYQNAKERLSQERFGVPYGGLTPDQRHLVVYDAGDETIRQFKDDEAIALISEAKGGSLKDLLADALASDKSAEKLLARKYQKLGLEDMPTMLRKSKELARFKTMAEYQRFLGVDDSMISKADISEAIIEHLGITDPREINRLKRSPNEAFQRLYNDGGELGTIIFSGRLFREKLEKFAQDREGEKTAPERKAGVAPGELTKDALVGMDPGGIAILMSEGKLTTKPKEYLESIGIGEKDAQKIVEDAEKFIKAGAIDEEAKFGMSADALAVLVQRRGIDLSDPLQAAQLHAELVESAKRLGVKTADRIPQADRKINETKELLEVTNGSRSKTEQEETIKKWDKKTLALLSLFLGFTFTSRITGMMADNEKRSFQNMFA